MMTTMMGRLRVRDIWQEIGEEWTQAGIGVDLAGKIFVHELTDGTDVGAGRKLEKRYMRKREREKDKITR